MNKPNFAKLAKKMRLSIVEHSPEILTGMGIAGLITTVVFAVKATPKALSILDESVPEEDKSDIKDLPTALPAKDVVRLTWKCYIPTIVTGASSILCIIGANSANTRKNMALATAYTLSETALKEYQEKVVETIGEKKEKTVRDAIAKDKIDKNPVNNKEIIITNKGNTLCYDIISGRYFRSDIDKIKKAENNLNRQIITDMYVSLNDFYHEIGLPPIHIGEDIGWNVERGLLELYFSSQLTKDDEPCLVVNYRIEPRYNYQDVL